MRVLARVPLRVPLRVKGELPIEVLHDEEEPTCPYTLDEGGSFRRECRETRA
jgi:hypothetical protein